MLQVFVEVLVPVYAIVVVGYAIARLVGIEPPALASLSYWILGPAFIFDVLAYADLAPDVVVGVVTASLIGMALVALVAVLAMRVIGADFSRVAATVLTSIHGNVGNFGLAICAFAFGVTALPIAGIVMVTVNTVGIVTGVGLATIRRGSLGRAVVTGFLSPLALAVIPALVVNLSNAQMPVWIDRPISLLAAALIPVMLLTLGIQIAGMPRALPARLVTVPIGVKLVLSPLAAFLAVTILGLGGTAAQVVVLQAAMPAAVFTSLIALKHDLDADYVTSVVLTGTLVSVITLPVVITFLA